MIAVSHQEVPMTEPHARKKFVIMMIGRSGSSYLTALLNSHPLIEARGEKMSGLTEADRQIRWLRRILNEPLAEGIQAIGFKTKLKDVLDRDRFRDVLEDEAAKMIMLRRRNIVKSAVSWVNADRLYAETGEWNITGSGSGSRMPPAEIDSAQFAERLGQLERAGENLEEYCDAFDKPCLKLWYEELLTNRDDTLRRIYEHLGIPEFATASTLRKNTSDNLRDAIVNFDALRASYAGTKYLEMFDEVLDQASTSRDSRDGKYCEKTS